MNIKCKVRINRIMFPKNKQVETGEFAIFTAELVEHIKGDKPIMHPHFKTISLKGNVPHIRERDIFTITFNEPETNNYGTSYKVVSVTKEIDVNDKKQLEDYFTIMCGKKIAKELMEVEGAYQMLQERNDEELLKIKGIGEARLEQIYSNIGNYSDISYAFTKLEPLGLTRNLISRICLAVGGAVSAVEICQENPYSLIKKVKGVSFIVADQIALKCGLDVYSNVRIKHAVLHVLQEAGEGGKSYLTAPQLIHDLRKAVSLDLMNIDGVIMELMNEGEISVSEDGTKVALQYYIDLESNIAKEIERIREAESNITIPDDWEEQVRAIEEAQGWCYTEEQWGGIKTSLEENLVVVSGKAGSGKSTVTNAMTQVLHNYSIEMCCLSAKASQRLREVTKMDAMTIHRLLGLGMEDTEEHNTLYADIVILDEASMVNGTLFLKLLKAIPSGSKLIILGDDGQLTAIGNCAVFSDLMHSGVVPHVVLTKIHRQAEMSAIITKSIDFRTQVKICKDDFAGHMIMGELQDLELFVLEQEMLLQGIKKKFLEDLKAVDNDILEVQVITALKTRGVLSVQNINHELQFLVNPKIGESFEGVNKTKIYIGDKVINLKNNYSAKNTDKKKVGVWNGSIGIVEKIEKEEVTIRFVGIGRIIIEKANFGSINLAYAISTHSSQGSQWRRVICGFDMSAYVLLNVEIVYTALTRASEHCSLFIDRKALNHSARTIEQKTKQTLLPMFLKATP